MHFYQIKIGKFWPFCLLSLRNSSQYEESSAGAFPGIPMHLGNLLKVRVDLTVFKNSVCIRNWAAQE